MKKLRVVWYLLLNGCATCSVNGGLFCVLSFTTASARGDLYLFYFCFARVLMWDYTFHGPTLLYELNGPIGLASFHLGLSLSLSLSLSIWEREREREREREDGNERDGVRSRVSQSLLGMGKFAWGKSKVGQERGKLKAFCHS